jgi:hypothetical protein
VDFQSANFVALEKNGDPTIGNDTTPDVTASGESSETPADQRYFVHRMGQGNEDAWRALTAYDTGGTANGRVAERWGSQRGAPAYLRGDSGSSELGSAALSSAILGRSSVFRQVRDFKHAGGDRLGSDGPEKCCGCTCVECEHRGNWHTGFLCGCPTSPGISILVRCPAPPGRPAPSDSGGGSNNLLTPGECYAMLDDCIADALV